MNINKFSVYITPKEIYDKILPEQKEQLSKVIITSADLLGDGCVQIECAALEKGIEITPKKEPAYRQCLMDDGYIVAIENSDYFTTLTN